MFVFFVNILLQNTMAEQNVPAQPPTRIDKQIISVDILSNTNFFRAFTASASIPAIYVQQKALAITPVDPAHPFKLPPSGKTSGSDKPKHPVLQMLWGIVTQTNVDHAELLWEEFTQGIQTFFSHKASHKPSLKDPKKKVTPLLIPYGRFSKVIIYYLASNNNIHRRPDSTVHHTGDDFLLGNLKFVLKGETVEVFGMCKRATCNKACSTQKAHNHHSSQTIQASSCCDKETFQLVDEDDEAQQESIPQEEGDDPDLELAKKMSLEAHQEKGEGEGDDADMERAIKLSLDPAFLPQG
ncbi:hypothetical protein Tco_0822650, partial [Tanacetum coccineum]